MNNSEIDSAFVLHTRPYTDTRIIIDFFCKDAGKTSGVFRFSRSRKQNNMPQQFSAYSVDWKNAKEPQSNSNLKTITLLESLGRQYLLAGKPLYCGLYLNELLLRLLPVGDPYPLLFDYYEQSLSGLRGADNIEGVLRSFELALFEEIGYGVDFYSDCHGSGIVENMSVTYQYIPGRGFVPLEPAHGDQGVSGELIHGVRQQNWQDKEVLKIAKALCRAIISDLLNGKPLRTRELFSSSKDISSK